MRSSVRGGTSLYRSRKIFLLSILSFFQKFNNSDERLSRPCNWSSIRIRPLLGGFPPGLIFGGIGLRRKGGCFCCLHGKRLGEYMERVVEMYEYLPKDLFKPLIGKEIYVTLFGRHRLQDDSVEFRLKVFRYDMWNTCRTS